MMTDIQLKQLVTLSTLDLQIEGQKTVLRMKNAAATAEAAASVAIALKSMNATLLDSAAPEEDKTFLFQMKQSLMASLEDKDDKS